MFCFMYLMLMDICAYLMHRSCFAILTNGACVLQCCCGSTGLEFSHLRSHRIALNNIDMLFLYLYDKRRAFAAYFTLIKC